MKECLVLCLIFADTTLTIIIIIVINLTATIFCAVINDGRPTTSVTRLVDFYKILAANCLTKVAQIFWSLLGLFLIVSLLCKSIWLLFGQFWGEIRQIFYSIIWSPCPVRWPTRRRRYAFGR